MASSCFEMYNQDKQGYMPPPNSMSPRISFSNDFAESSSSSSSHSQMRGAAASYRDAPVSSDFEFSVTNYSMMSADELLSKGKLLPFKGNCRKAPTLRDQLKKQEDGEFAMRPPKSPTKWRGFLGLRKSHAACKKSDKPDGSHQDTKNSQDSVVE